ncbi:uncharacterized protein LOC129597353 [Paramacrobiotus metropolitanus]|uniref:uncharacterized protein LOC129597353 n=1 Tax=Paramacrobiotus metropolitanus TaxID=2943436 RepID=UPI0024455FC3|nr:uncharacterized protein LOC129597353 [Paramacrobiotus metropolitanus]
MGGTYPATVEISIQSIAPYADPVTSAPGYLQWWQIRRLQNSTDPSSLSFCPTQHWTGSYTSSGQQIGDLGGPNDNYIMRPTDFVVLYHDYQNLMVSYGCSKPRADGVHCAAPTIIAQTRTRPDRLSAEQMDSFDNIINSIFSKYCITVQSIPRDEWEPKGLCIPVEPPGCIGEDYRGMRNTIVNTTSSSSTATIAASSYGSSNTTSSICKWPNTMPSPGVINNTLISGTYYVYRRMFAPEPDPVNMVAEFHNIGPSASPLISASAASRMRRPVSAMHRWWCTAFAPIHYS